MSHGSLWAMDRTTFRRIILKTACKKRKMYETLLETVPMLRALTVSGIIIASIHLLRPHAVFLNKASGSRCKGSLRKSLPNNFRFKSNMASR